jgi:hypothetical protein
LSGIDDTSIVCEPELKVVLATSFQPPEIAGIPAKSVLVA